MRFENWGSKDWKRLILKIDKQSRDTTYLRTRLWNSIHKKLWNIIEKKSEICKCIVILISDFYQLRAKERLIYKHSTCIGIKEWCTNTGVIVLVSAAQAMEGHHYYRCMHVHKKCLNALFQCRFQKVKS